MKSSEARKLDFVFKREPVKVRVYAVPNLGSAKAEISGIDLSAPMNITQLHDLKEIIENAISEVEEMERSL